MLTIEDANLLDPNKKGKDYCLRNAKEIHNNYSNQRGYFFNQKIQWLLNRKYSRGAQPIDNCKAALGRNRAISFDSLNWKVPKAMPIIFDIMVGIISRLDMYIQCDSVDPESVRKKELDRYRKEAEIFYKEQIAGVEKEAGFKLRSEDNQYEDVEELEIDIDAGKFKLDLEIAMEQVIEELFDFNRVEELRKTLIRDGANCGMAILRHYVQNNGLVKIRRVDPLNFVSDFVRTRDFREMGKCGEYVDMNMAQLRQVSNFSDKEYIDIAQRVAGKYGNPTFENIGGSLNLYLNQFGGGYIFDNFIVRYLSCEWSTTNRYNHIVDRPNKYGNKKTKLVPKVDYEPSENSKPYHKATDYLVWYKCNWIVDTDYCFDFGPVQFPNVKQSALNESQSTFAVCAVDLDNMIMATYTDRVIEQMDMAYLAWMQYQSHLAKAVPPGVAADIFALTNIPSGKGTKYEPLQVLDRFVATGNLLMNTLMPNGQIAQRLPIEVLNGSDFSKAVAFYQQFLQHIETAKQFLGINEFVDASNPNPEQSVGGARLAVQGTNNSLVPIITCIDTVFVKTAEGIVNRCQHLAANGELDYMASAIGNQSLLMLKLTNELSAAAFGINMGPRIDKEAQARIDAYVQQSLAQRSTTGVGGIEVEDALAIERYKSPKAKERLLIIRRQKRQRMDAEISKQEQMNNSAVQTQAIEAKRAADMDMAMQEFKLYQKKKEIDFVYKQKELFLQGKLKEDQIEKTGEVKDQNILTQGIVDKKLADAQPKETKGESK